MKKLIIFLICFLSLIVRSECTQSRDLENHDDISHVVNQFVHKIKTLEEKKLSHEEILTELSNDIQECLAFDEQQEKKFSKMKKTVSIIALGTAALVGTGALVWYLFFNTKKTPQNTSPGVSSQPHHDRYVIRTAGNHSRAINLVLIDGDITRQNFPDNTHGAIVNAANAQLGAGGGVCGAIFRAAGQGLTEECNRIGGCPTGNAVITGGGNLHPIRIIHAVGPQGVNPQQLRNTYQATLQIADNNQITHVSIPAISTGIYGYDVRNATPVAIDAIVDYLQQNQNTQLSEIRLINLGEERMNIYRNALDNHEHINPS